MSFFIDLIKNMNIYRKKFIKMHTNSTFFIFLDPEDTLLRVEEDKKEHSLVIFLKLQEF